MKNRMNKNIHSWPRRSGKTGAAVSVSHISGLPYFSPIHSRCNHFVKNNIVIFPLNDIHGIKKCVVDNYERCTDEQKAIIAEMDVCHIFGTFGPCDGDYKIGDAKIARNAMEDVESGILSFNMAMRDMMNIPCK